MVEYDINLCFGISCVWLVYIVVWLIDLFVEEVDCVCVGIVEKIYVCGVCICLKNILLESWMGVVMGFIKIGMVLFEGCSVMFMGVLVGGWFGEGMVFKNELCCYDIVVLCDMCMVFMDCVIFMWLVENSVVFNCFLVK